MRKQHELNASVIKTTLKSYGVKVISCAKGKGTSKKSTYIVVASESVDNAFVAFQSLGIVSVTGSAHRHLKCSGDSYAFGACFMSDEMFEELN